MEAVRVSCENLLFCMAVFEVRFVWHYQRTYRIAESNKTRTKASAYKYFRVFL